jgi:hypothetical protein
MMKWMIDRPGFRIEPDRKVKALLDRLGQASSGTQRGYA